MILDKWYMDKFGRYWKASKIVNLSENEFHTRCSYFCANTENRCLYISREREKEWKMILANHITDDDVKNGQLAIYGH